MTGLRIAIAGVVLAAVAVTAGVWRAPRGGDRSDPSDGTSPVATTAPADLPAWERDNPVRPLPEAPLGIDRSLADLKDPPTPERVRLGRWLFFDKRLSGDGTLSCASCHQPKHGFSEPLAVSVGVGGKSGTRKASPLLNLAWTIYPHFFWDGRADSLETQAVGPMFNPIEMGGSPEAMIRTLTAVKGYAPYFKQAFGDETIHEQTITDQTITVDRVAKALADYQRTRFSGNSPYDRWRAGDESAVSDAVKKGNDLFFFGKASCNQCHLGPTFTDSAFHNLGVGYDGATKTFRDEGRFAVTKKPEDRGAFKTPTLRDVARRAPYLHDGSAKTLRDVVELYNRGGVPNPRLSDKIKPLGLTSEEIDQIVAFLEALNGEGFADEGPTAFPK